MIVDTLERHEALVRSLMSEACWPEGGADRQRIDTHISTVVLSGDHAYKLKKPLDLGFLDFVSLQNRHQACVEEVRINRRLAPAIYEDACAITGSIETPVVGGDGAPIDWAVKMRRFDPEAVLSDPAGRLDGWVIDDLGGQVGRFHDAVDRAPGDSIFGDFDSVATPMRQNFTQISEHWPAVSGQISALSDWTESELARCSQVLRQRRQLGYVRECHGDLHLGNIAMIEDRPVVFDAIEFSAALRWIDTANDVAFLTMDLKQRQRPGLAFRFLDRYLQETGDYGLLQVLRLYECYRAMVRAKIAVIRRSQVPDEARAAVEAECIGYIELAGRLGHMAAGALVITYGLSGSGKSHVASTIVDRFPAVRLRSDVERKRLLGLDAGSDATHADAYSAAHTTATYERLVALAETVFAAGYIAVVDATFLQRRWRDRFRNLAHDHGVPFVIVECTATEATLAARIRKRSSAADNVSDAGIGVMQRQAQTAEPLAGDERQVTVHVSLESALDIAELESRLGHSAFAPA